MMNERVEHSTKETLNKKGSRDLLVYEEMTRAAPTLEETLDMEKPLYTIEKPEVLPGRVLVYVHPIDIHATRIKKGEYKKEYICGDLRAYSINEEKIDKFYHMLSMDASLQALIKACEMCGTETDPNSLSGKMKIKSCSPPVPVVSATGVVGYHTGTPTYGIFYEMKPNIMVSKTNVAPSKTET